MSLSNQSQNTNSSQITSHAKTNTHPRTEGGDGTNSIRTEPDAIDQGGPAAKRRCIGRYEVAILETAVIAFVVLVGLAALLTTMSYFAKRPQTKERPAQIQGETPEDAWRKYDDQRRTQKEDMCQNFPGNYEKIIGFIKRPYQIIGEPCTDYYNLVCSGVCHILPFGVCFAETAQKFFENCEPGMDKKSADIWKDLFTFNTKSNYIVHYRPSKCSELLYDYLRDDLRDITNGNRTLTKALFDRVMYMVHYVSSRRLCVEDRLMLYELFCLSLCCHDVDGSLAVELGRVLCRGVVTWRVDFTAYYRCPQDLDIIKACWPNVTDPVTCE